MTAAQTSPTRYALAGTGSRGLSFARAIVGEFASYGQLVALHDTNGARMAAFAEALAASVPLFANFEQMAHAARPDVLIICTPDHTHDVLIAQAFAHGMDAICEKPLATSVDKVKRIASLQKAFNRSVRVTFNVRYTTFAQQLKRCVMETDIGTIRHAKMQWWLDKIHGAEYFRRWHRNRANSGGLLVHKATHHFDYVNWLLGDRPVAVSATGALQHFGASGPFRDDRCSTCAHTAKCPHYIDYGAMGDDTAKRMKAMYFDAEHEDRYVRDRCVFGKDIDIHDTMNVLVDYAGGAQLVYSLTAYAPCEGYRLTLIGDKGMIEADEMTGGIMLNDLRPGNNITIIRGSNRRDITIDHTAVPYYKTDHGGGDHRLFQHLFQPDMPDPLGQVAGFEDGAASCLIGICANQSIDTGRRIALPSLTVATTDAAAPASRSVSSH